MKIKKNDMVLITSGDDKGKKGKVLAVYPAKNRILVEGVIKFFKTGEDTAGTVSPAAT